jgi:hypothetical protein
MQAQRHLVARSIAWLPSRRTHRETLAEVRPAAGGVSLRVDLSPSCAATDLAIFATQVSANRPAHKVIEPESEWV